MTAVDEISKAIALLFKPGDVVELRAPQAGRFKATFSGYYSDHEKLAEAVRKLSKNSTLPGIYWTINPCLPACLARSPEELKPYAKTTTSDSEIARRRWLPIDCDAKRVAGVSSTEEEKAAAGDVASRILKDLHEEGFRGLVLADSGNGWHILIPVDLLNDADSTALCSAVLSALAQKFDTDKAQVDKKLFNASHLLKAYGTVARKGSNTPERPHRMSRIVAGGNGHHAPVARELLEKIAARVKAPLKEEKQSNDTAAKMEEFLDWGNIQHRARMDYRDGLKWQVDCPFDESHRIPDAVVHLLPSGALAFRCSHNSCEGRTWWEFRELVEKRKGAKFQFNNSKSATLSNLPAVVEAEHVLVVRSAKDVEAAREKYGLVATLNPIGAGLRRDEFSDVLTGKKVTIIGDNEHAEQFAKSCYGKAGSLAIAQLPLGIKGLSHYAELGFSREALLEILDQAPPWKPGAAAADLTGFHLTLLADLLARPDIPVEYVVENLLVAGTVACIVAKPKVGKSTLARNLCLSVSRGLDFLGLKTKRGECIHLALEEREEDLKNDFRAMGADGSEPIYTYAAAAPAEGIDAACNLVRQRRPVLIVIDPLFRLTRIKDEKAYAETYTALGPLIDVAREVGTLVVLVHHAGKSAKTDAIDSPLGSTAIAGAVCTVVLLKKQIESGTRTFQTVTRVGQEMPESVLCFDSASRCLSLGPRKEDADAQAAEEAILEYLKSVGEPKTEPEIDEAVEGKTGLQRMALRALLTHGKVTRSGGGKRGDPYKYTFLFSCSQGIAGTREQETAAEVQVVENKDRNSCSQNSQNSILVPEVGDQQNLFEAGPNSALVEELNRRVGALEPPLYKDRDAIPLLQKNGLTRKQARQVIKAGEGSEWRLVPLAGEPGPPIGVLPIGYGFVANRGYIKVNGGGDTTTQPPARNGPFEHSPLRRPLEMHAAESGGFGPVEPTNVTPDPLSAAGSNDKGGGGAKPSTEEEL